MRRSILIPGLLLISAASAAEAVRVESAANRVTVSRGPLVLVFDQSGKGFLTSGSLGDTEVCAASESGGFFASLASPPDGSGVLEPLRSKEIIGQVKVTRATGNMANASAQVEIAGTVAFEGLGESPFTVRVTVPVSGPAMAASVEMELPDRAKRSCLTSFGLALPLKLNFHSDSGAKSQVDRKTVAAVILPRAGIDIPEVRWLVGKQDQTSVWGPMLWTLAGIRQASPSSCEVWEAWGTQNPPFVLQHHRVHPGWMAVADNRVAVAAGLPGIEKIAPKEIYTDSQAKVLRVCFQSPYCRPLDISSAPTMRLSAGPACFFIEAAQANTRNAEEYRDAKKRPALAAIAEALAKMPPAQCNFGALKSLPPLTLPSPQGGEGRVRGKDPALAPADPEFSSHEPSPPTEISIWVDEPTGADLGSSPVPVTRGIPLKRGALTDEKQAALFDAEGKPVPCFPKAVAFWPDRSVKWLLLDFQARLKAGVGAKLKLVVGNKAARTAGVPPAPEAGETPALRVPLKIAEAPGNVSVDTGKLKATFANQGGEKRLALTIGLDLNGDGKVTDEETVIKPGPEVFGCSFSHIADPEHYPSRVWLDPGEPDPGVSEITELKIEEQSPLRAVVLVRANLKHRLLASTIDQKNRPQVGTPVTLRFHLYANSSMVRLQHTFMFAGDVRFDFLRELGIRLPLPAQAGQAIRTSLEGVSCARPRDGETGLLQENADSALVWPESGWQGGDATHGRAADGWLDVSGERWGVTVGLRNMREMFPKEIHVDKDGIWTHFYSSRVPPMDVRRYAFKYGDGESTSTGFGSAFGALRTHEACWFFHPGAEQAAKGALHVQAMLQPPLARVRPRYVADTLVAGHVAEHGATGNDQHFDNVLYHLPRMHRHNRDFWRWFGFWDFGDEVQVYNAYVHRWAVDDGRYGWYNNEPVRDYNYHLAYLMTGNRRIWEAAEYMSYHVYEVDVRHANPQPFMSAQPSLAKQAYSNSTRSGIDINGRRHNCQHWSDGYFGPRVGAPPGFRLCYYQTGDPVMREYMERILAAAMKTRRSEYMSADGDEAILWAMIMGYEMTLDQKYLDRINGYVNCQLQFAPQHNGIPAAKANWDWATNTAGAPPEDPRGDMWIWSFGGHLALIEIADVFQNPALDKLLNDWIVTVEGAGPDHKRREEWSNNIGPCPLLAHFYRTTGDKRALEWFKYRASKFHSGIPKDAPTVDLSTQEMENTLPIYTPNDGYGWVYTTTTFWYVGIPAWQGALREQAGK